MSSQSSQEMHDAPDSFRGVMISGTFFDLEEHRRALADALSKQDLHPVWMEDYTVNPVDDVISSSLEMVRKGSAYIGLISRRYGQIPEDDRNPEESSITRLEFERAQELKRPTLVFVMGKNHPVTEDEVELDPEKRIKLEDFRVRAKKGRIYVEFQSLKEFEKEAIHAAARLKRFLDEEQKPSPAAPEPAPSTSAKPGKKIPKAPDFYAEPPYIGSHKFVGRQHQLDILNDWAKSADPHPLLLFEAIGGSGKSMLTWEWSNRHATKIREDWAGRFWYSFYEKGARLETFCRYALTYMSGQPLENFEKMKTPELGDLLLAELQEKPWLLVLDGLERVLVAYNRSDAAELSDEEAGNARDQIADRDPCSAIRPEDDDLLKALAGSGPSKLLLTSRLAPHVLLNSSSQPINGVLRKELPGLRPADAEEMLRVCGVTGDSRRLQDFLQNSCDCHPLTTGVIAGLVQNYLPDRGDFDTWLDAPDGGGQLNLANLDLTQKRNHILEHALADLPRKGHALLSTLSLLSESVDYELLLALNPHLPSEPEEAESAELQSAPELLAETVKDLEQRGLLQYDANAKRYDLHPVVRSVISGRLSGGDLEQYGQRVVDHFSSKAHDPYDEADSLEDLSEGIQLYRNLMRLERSHEAHVVYKGFSTALKFNCEAYFEGLELLRLWFPTGWDVIPNVSDTILSSDLLNEAGIGLSAIGEFKKAASAHEAAIRIDLAAKNWSYLHVDLSNMAENLFISGGFAISERLILPALRLAEFISYKEKLFITRLAVFVNKSEQGRWSEADKIWSLLDPMGRNWARATYRPGQAEAYYAWHLFYQGQLTEEILTTAKTLAVMGRNREAMKSLHHLRGLWHLERKEPESAIWSFQEEIRMDREVGKNSRIGEACLALARFRAGKLSEADASAEADRLAKARKEHHGRADLALGELWLELGEAEKASRHALVHYEWAWADGEPYVRRYQLNKVKELLEKLGVEPPELAPYDPSKDVKFDWEDDLIAAIEKMEAKKEQALRAER